MKASQLDRIELKLDTLLAKKKPSKPRASKKEYPDWFEEIWKMRPRRSGSDPKGKAWSAMNARVICRSPAEKKVAQSDMHSGMVAYKDYCEATGILNTQYVLQAATFFGPDKHYENDWTIPAKEDNVPTNDLGLNRWAEDRGYRMAYLSESYAAYRRALTILHKAEQEQGERNA